MLVCLCANLRSPKKLWIELICERLRFFVISRVWEQKGGAKLLKRRSGNLLESVSSHFWGNPPRYHCQKSWFVAKLWMKILATSGRSRIDCKLLNCVFFWRALHHVLECLRSRIDGFSGHREAVIFFAYYAHWVCASVMQVPAQSSLGSIEQVVERIFRSHRITRADQQLFMNALLTKHALSREDRANIDRVFEGLRWGLLRVVD